MSNAGEGDTLRFVSGDYRNGVVCWQHNRVSVPQPFARAPIRKRADCLTCGKTLEPKTEAFRPVSNLSNRSARVCLDCAEILQTRFFKARYTIEEIADIFLKAYGKQD